MVLILKKISFGSYSEKTSLYSEKKTGFILKKLVFILKKLVFILNRELMSKTGFFYFHHFF